MVTTYSWDINPYRDGISMEHDHNTSEYIPKYLVIMTTNSKAGY